MMAICPPDERINKLLKGFGLDLEGLTFFQLTIGTGQAVVVETKRLVKHQHLDGFITQVEEISKTYKLCLEEVKPEEYDDDTDG